MVIYGFDKLVEKFPEVLYKVAAITIGRLQHNRLMAVLPNIYGSCDEIRLQEIEAQFEWCHLRRGEVLFKQGDIEDNLYIINTPQS